MRDLSPAFRGIKKGQSVPPASATAQVSLVQNKYAKQHILS